MGFEQRIFQPERSDFQGNFGRVLLSRKGGEEVFFHVSDLEGVKIEVLEEGGTMDFEKNGIAAIYVNDTVVCTNCMADEDWNLLTQDCVITRKEADEKDKIFFCDRCSEPI